MESFAWLPSPPLSRAEPFRRTLDLLGRARPKSVPKALEQWAENQRALARALGLSVEEWLIVIEAASRRATGLLAAAVGAAVARGQGLGVLEGLDGPKLGDLARTLIDPNPPRAENPLLKEAIRRADDLGLQAGAGARRLKAQKTRTPLPVPLRDARPLGESADVPTPDAPGRSQAAPASQPGESRRTEGDPVRADDESAARSGETRPETIERESDDPGEGEVSRE